MKKKLRVMFVIIFSITLLLIFFNALNEATIIYTSKIVENDRKEKEDFLKARKNKDIVNGVYGEYFENGYRIKGTYNDNLLNGYTEIYSSNDDIIYKGYVYEGLYHGYGTLYRNGSIQYEGPFSQGKYDGFGKYTLYDENGNVKEKYVGTFRDGMKNGYGKLYIEGKEIFGTFYNDVYDGKYYYTEYPIVPFLPSLLMEANDALYEDTNKKSKEKFKFKINSNLSSNLNSNQNLKWINNLKENIMKVRNYVSKDIKQKEKENKISVISENVRNENDCNNVINWSKNNNVSNETKITRSQFEDLITRWCMDNGFDKPNEIFQGDATGDLMLDKNITYEEALEVIYKALIENDINVSEEILCNDWSKDTLAIFLSIGILENTFDFRQEISLKAIYDVLDKLKESGIRIDLKDKYDIDNETDTSDDTKDDDE